LTGKTQPYKLKIWEIEYKADRNAGKRVEPDGSLHSERNPCFGHEVFDPGGAVQSLRLSVGINMACREKDPGEASGIHLQYSGLCRRRTAQ